MATKKGVSTKMILSLGIVLLVAIVLLIGANVIAPLFSGTEAHAMFRTGLSIDAVLAAPEDIELKINLPEKIESYCDVAFYNSKVGTIESSRCGKYNQKFANTIKDIEYKNCDEVDDEPDEAMCSYDHPDKLNLKKKYNELKGKNKKLKISP